MISFSESDDFIRQEEVDYYVDLISNAQLNGLYAQLPTSAQEHIPREKNKLLGKLFSI